MDLSLQSRSLSSTFNNTGPYSMPQDEYEHKHRNMQQSNHQQAPSNNYILPITSLHSTSAENTSAAHQQLPQHLRSTISIPAANTLERVTDLVANLQSCPPTSTILLGSNPKYANLNGKDCERLLPPASAMASATFPGSGSHNSTKNATQYLHDSENYNDSAQIKHGYHGVSETRSTQNPTELINKDCPYSNISNKHEHSSKKFSPHHYHQPYMHPQQGRYSLPVASSQNLTISPTLAPKSLPAASQYAHASLRSTLSAVESLSNQMAEHESHRQHQIGIREREEYDLQREHQHGHTSFFPQHYQQLSNEPRTNIQRSPLTPPDLLPLGNAGDNYEKSFNRVICEKESINDVKSSISMNHSSPKPNSLIAFTPANQDNSESSSSNEEFTENGKQTPGKKLVNENTKINVLEKEILLDVSHNKSSADVVQTDSSPKDRTIKCANSLSNSRIESHVMEDPNSSDGEETSFRSTTTTSVITEKPNILLEPNIAQKISEISTKNSNDSNESTSLQMKEDVGPLKLSNKTNKMQRQVLRSNSNSNSSINSFNESILTNDNAINAEDLRLQCKDKSADVINKIKSAPIEVSESEANITFDESVANHSFNGSSNIKSRCISKEANDSTIIVHDIKKTTPTDDYTAKDVADSHSHSETKADILIDIVENTRKISSHSSVSGSSSAICNDHPEIKSPDKTCFEEVENKLEEMFAGIEDEPIVRQNSNDITTQASVSCDEKPLELELSVKSSITEQFNSRINRNEKPEFTHLDNKIANTPPKIERSLPTKAAKKSTETCNVLPMKVDADLTSYLTDMQDSKRIRDPSPNHISEPLDTNEAIAITNDKSKLCLDDIASSRDDSSSTSVSTELNKIHSGNNKCIKKRNAKTTARQRSAKHKSKAISKANTKAFKATKSSPCDNKQKTQEPAKIRPRQLRNSLPGHDDYTIPNDTILKTSRDADIKHRSPFILIKKDGSISVVNTTSTEDVSEKNTKIKKTSAFIQGRKNVRGLHSSTLSNKYDADTTDSSWICVFCKRGPHKMGLGDLFGPYVASINCDEYLNIVNSISNKIDAEETFAYKRSRTEGMHLNTRNFLAIASRKSDNFCPAAEMISKRRKRHTNEFCLKNDNGTGLGAMVNCNAESNCSDFLLGMCKISDGNYEVWLHEDCAVWAPDIFLVGSQVVGIANSVWNSARAPCSLCFKPGAMVCCLQRDCKLLAHLPCAKEAQWSLDESTFWVFCQKHIHSRHLSKQTLTIPQTT
uniref:PHD-type domain-containing protein n=1 Tax=Glossina pallidipes TaxID=7398 RepID=A0A1A9Z585_GLOPL